LIRNVARLKAWTVWFDSDTHITLLTIFYVLLTGETLKEYGAYDLLALVVSLELALACGALISDYHDIPFDKLSGKKRAIYAIPRRALLVLIVALFVLCYVVTIIAIGQVLYLVIYTLWAAVGSFYSAPPLKLKYRGVHGVWCNALMEKTFPVSLVLVYFGQLRYDTVILALLSFFIQVETIIRHQLEDFAADLGTRSETLVVKIGPDRAKAILGLYARPLSAILICLVGLTASVHIPPFALMFGAALVAYFFVDMLIRRGRLLRDDRRFVPLYYGYLYFCLQSPFLLFLGFLSTLRSFVYIIPFMMTIASQYPLVTSYYKVFRGFLASVTGK